MNKDKIPLIKLLIVIIDRDQRKRLYKIFKKEHVHLQYECLGEGTASSDISDILGLGEIEKSVILCFGLEERLSSLMDIITLEMHLKKPGTGIAFTMPLSGISNLAFKILDEDTRNKIEQTFEKEVKKMKADATHDLILSIVNQGYTDDVMAAAREAGATGGTIIHGRGVGMEETMDFFGIAVQPEKEIVLILATRETKNDIMKAICKSCGMNSEARGIAISLPADGVSMI